MSILISVVMFALIAYGSGAAAACAWAWFKGQDPDPSHKGREHDA